MYKYYLNLGNSSLIFMSQAPSSDRHLVVNFQPTSRKQSHIISKVLSPAVRLWLRSQVEQVEDLQVKIQGGDRAILTGYIPKVSLSARQAVYQGLHLREIQLAAVNIAINLGQVLKGKALRLLEPIPVTGELKLQQADLQESLKSSLLSNALTEFLLLLLKEGGCPNRAEILQNRQISWNSIAIEPGKIAIEGAMSDHSSQNTYPLLINAAIELASPNQLELIDAQIEGLPNLNLASLNGLKLDLGSDVDLQELTLTAGQLICRGGILVRG